MFNPNSEVRQLGISLRRRGQSAFPDMNILVWEDGNVTFAHCLELDIVGDGENEEEALKTLAELIIAQIEFSEQKNTALFRPAPKEYWEKLWELHANRVKQSLADHPPRSSREVLNGLCAVHA